MKKTLSVIAFFSISMLMTSVHAQETKAWIDITNEYIKNPGFDGNSASGWTWESDAQSQNVRVECMEFWNGKFNIWQSFDNMEKGKYRMSVQAYFRAGENDQTYNAHTNNTENITGYMYANSTKKKLASIYSYELPEYVDGCWTYSSGGGWWWGDWGETKYFPNSMESGRVAFDNGAYMNSMEFELTDNTLVMGLINETRSNNNWCLFDNFKLEYYGNVTRVTAIKFEAPRLSLYVGDRYAVKYDVEPADATIKTLKWTSSNTRVATVDQNGVIIPMATGTTTITGTSTDGGNVRGSVQVAVSNPSLNKDQLVVNEVMSSNLDQYLDPSTNYGGWIELYNVSERSAGLNGCYLSDDPDNLTKWRMPMNIGAVSPKSHKVIWFDHSDICQTNATFTLDCDGGTLYLSDSDGKLVLTQQYPASKQRIAYARTTDAGDEWSYTGTPTPGSSNNGNAYAMQQLPAPVVDKDGQIYSGSLQVVVNIPQGATLRFTEDGSTPTMKNGETSTTGTFMVYGNANFKFRLFRDGYLPSDVVTRSYIGDGRSFTLPVVSITANDDDLYGDYTGIMVRGTNGKTGYGQNSPCNWNMDWDRAANIQYITPDNQMVLNQEVDLSMAGGWSRAWTPHTLKAKAKKKYGINSLDYQFFPIKKNLKNKAVKFRNGGNDTSCRFKDACLSRITLLSGIDIDAQDYQPVLEYINGQYIGLLNLRELNNKDYAYSNYGWDEDEIDQFKFDPDSGYIQNCGDDVVVQRIYELSSNAEDPEIYDSIKTMLDIDEYINYLATELYIASNDWASNSNNIKGFRNRNNGRYRFVMFDTDAAFSLSNAWTSLASATKNRQRFGPIFVNMLDNEEFRKQLIDTYCIVCGSVFEPTRCTKVINEMVDNVSDMMRIEGASPTSSANSMKSSINSRLNTAINNMRSYTKMKLSSVSPTNATLTVNNANGRILINGIQVPNNYFRGKLFAPMRIKAVAPGGLRFLGWKSGADNRVTSTVFSKETNWKYYDQGSLDGQDWSSTDFTDTSWKAGKAPLGYGNDDSKFATRLDYGGNSSNKNPTLYFRRSFYLSSAPDANDIMELNYTVDDGFIIYINGKEAGRYNMPSGKVSFSTFATQYNDENPDGTLELDPKLFQKGTNIVAMEVHNNAANSTDSWFDAELTMNKVATPDDDYYSKDEEIELTSNNLSLMACFQSISEDERETDSIMPVRINEVSAANSIYVNEYFKKNDWVELYNTTDEAIDLEGMYLSDNPKKPQKFMITKGDTKVNTVIPAHGYLIIWCDKLENQDELHADFKLAAEGGTVSIQASDGSWTDQLTYPAHDGNSTVGRYPDGSNDLYLMSVPTFNKSNVLSSYTKEVENGKETVGVKDVILATNNGLRIYFNSPGTLLIKSDDTRQADVRIFNAAGQTVMTDKVDFNDRRAQVEVSGLQPGIYIAKATDEEDNTCGVKFIIR